MTNTQKNTVENVINEYLPPQEGKNTPNERTIQWFKAQNKLNEEVTIANRDKLKADIAATQDANEQITLFLQQFDPAGFKKTSAWRALTPEQKSAFEVPVAAVPVNKEEVHSHKRHDGRLEGGHDNEITTLKGEITNMLAPGGAIRGVRGSERLIAVYSKELNEPTITADKLKIIRDSLNQMQDHIKNFNPTNALEIIEKINNYQESREEKNTEGSMLLYGVIVKSIHDLGFRIKFGRGDAVQIEGGDPDGAASLTTAFSGKKDVVEWLKRGLVINTSKWGNYMSSYPSQETATVDKYMSTFEGRFNDSKADKDFKASSGAGGFDVIGPDGKWVTRGMNVHNIAIAAQQASKKWKEMGYATPIEKAGGAPVQFMDMAYNVAKFGFAAASVWKGTKALWKTIFGDETAMKAAWGDFGKTLAWTGAVWYGGEAVKRLSNDIKSGIDLPNYTASIKQLSTQPGKSGMYDGFVSIWKKIGGGIMPDMDGKMTGLVETLMPSTVPAHQFKEMWEVLCTGRKGEQFLDLRISDLSKALDNSYHSKDGSHVGGLKGLFYDQGQWGKDVYDKFLIDDNTGDKARKFLRAIADYRSEDSFEGAHDAIPNRDMNIRDLFDTPLAKKTEVPTDIDPEMRALKESLKGAGVSILESGIKLGTLGATGVRVAFEGIEGAFDIATDTLKNLTPAELGVLKGALAVLGLTVAGAGAIYGISLIPGFAAAKVLAITAVAGAVGYGGYKLIDTAKGLLDDPDKLIEFLKKNGPQNVKDIISELESAGKTSSDLLKDIKEKTVSIPGIPDWIPKSIDDMLKKIPGSGSGGTEPSRNSEGGGTEGAGETPSTIPTEL